MNKQVRKWREVEPMGNIGAFLETADDVQGLIRHDDSRNMLVSPMVGRFSFQLGSCEFVLRYSVEAGAALARELSRVVEQIEQIVVEEQLTR